MTVLKLLVVFGSALSCVTGTIYGEPIKRYCLNNDTDPYLLFGIKTSYDVVRGNAEPTLDCKPIQFWLLNRHGTRNPSPNDVNSLLAAPAYKDKIIKNYENDPPLYGGLCKNDLEALRNWTLDESLANKTYELVKEGWRELREIGERYKKKFPQLLEGYSEENFNFRHTDTQRTWASCRAFIEGLFGTYENITIEDPLSEDSILKPYDMCPAWKTEIANNVSSAERNLFKEQKDFRELIINVSYRLRLYEDLTNRELFMVYDACRFVKSWYPSQVSPWCAAFTKSELKVLEYLEDLKEFYRTGYSHEFNAKLGCVTLRNMMETFEKTIDTKEAKPRVVAMFSHDTLLSLVFTALNYAKDDKPLKGTDYDDLLANRKFRTSLNIPFATSLAAILYECNPGYKVQFFLNEKPMEIDGCPQGICTWEHLKTILSATKDCNLDFCQEK